MLAEHHFLAEHQRLLAAETAKSVAAGAAYWLVREDDARELADQVRREASADATVRAGHSAVYLPFSGF